jgi:hypothetical protein
VVASGGGMAGNGTPGDPIRIDPNVVPSKTESNRIIETESTAAAGGLGAAQANPKASGGSVRFAAASAAAGGSVWKVQRAQVGAFANGTAIVSLSAAVTNNALTSNLATLRCGATRGTNTVEVGTAVTMHPNDFPGAGAFRTFEISCAWLPDDADQYIEVTDFATGITDLSIDFVRVIPLTGIRGPWDGAVGSGENHAFCVGNTYSFTRLQAAGLCKAVGMRLCTLAELSAYAETDNYASCCWGWVADPAVDRNGIHGTAAYFMYSSQTARTIAGACGGNPGGMRINDNQPNTTPWAAHCCK